MANMDDDLLDQRVVVMMGRRELAAIDEWRFKNRLGSRAEAIRQLIRKGFMAEMFGQKSSAPESDK